jgi:hypothetical protein
MNEWMNQPSSVSVLSMSVHVWHRNVDWLSKISVLDRNDREELISVYEVGLHVIPCRKLFQWCQCYDEPGLLSSDFSLKSNWCIDTRCLSSGMGLRCLSISLPIASTWSAIMRLADMITFHWDISRFQDHDYFSSFPCVWDIM